MLWSCSLRLCCASVLSAANTCLPTLVIYILVVECVEVYLNFLVNILCLC